MSSRLAFGVVGAAGRGAGFFKAIQMNPNAEIAALCDINEEGLHKQGEAIGVKGLFTDYEKMLDSVKLNAVVVGTPMPFHVPQSIAALERGISVMSEVPAGVSIEECKELVQICKKTRAKYMMAENYCYVSSPVLVREIVHAGLLGEPYYGEGQYLHELKELNEITKWRRKWQTGINGNTYPTHSLGPLLQWFRQRVAKVCCAGSGHHYRDPRGDYYGNEDSTTALCRLEKGGLIELRLDMLSERPHNMNYHSIQGTEGCYESPRCFGDRHKIYVKGRRGSMEWIDLYEFQDEFMPEQWKNPPQEAKEAGHEGGDYWVIQDFVQSIVEDKQPPIGIHEAMDMTLPGLISQQSIIEDSAWLDVPDSRKW